jgi:trans-2,3-dihydro-3-hydroxyanthranilate isomerase
MCGMSTHRYLHLDVFTDRRFAGNQLAVFPRAAEIPAEVMQQMAAEINYSETTFVLPAEVEGTDCRMRIFTPGAELPMAGHPTIGSTFALAHEGVIESGATDFVFGEGGRLAFAWMRQTRHEFGPTVAEQESLAAALGIDTREIPATGLAPQVVSSGVPVLFVALAERRAVDDSLLDRSGVQRVFADLETEELPVFVFSLEPANDDATAYSRMFAPSFGIAEDPATGGASGPLGAYLVRHGAVSHCEGEQMVSLQGVAMGRPSRIHISIRRDPRGRQIVEVGGVSVRIGEGTIEL